MLPETIAEATGIPNIGEQWNKRQQLEKSYYEPYIKPGYMRHLSRVFPFHYLNDQFAPLMKLIIRYFSCDGRFSLLDAYHVRLLMHFTRVSLMNIPYFMFRNIERMVVLVQRKTPAWQHTSIYHYALIKIVGVHQLAQQGITWEDFISRDFFIAPQPPPEMPPPEIVHDEGEPSQQFDILEAEHVNAPVYMTYQRGHKALFAATRRVLSPHGVEGVSPSSSAQVQVQIQDRGKRLMHEEGPSGGHDIDVTVTDVDRSSPSSELKEII